MRGELASAGTAGSSGGGGSSANETAARRRPGALSMSTPSLSAADLPLPEPTLPTPRKRTAVARFLVRELCLCMGGGAEMLSDEL